MRGNSRWSRQREESKKSQTEQQLALLPTLPRKRIKKKLCKIFLPQFSHLDKTQIYFGIFLCHALACWLCWLESLRIPTRHIFTCAVSLLLATSTHLQHCPFLGFPFGSHSLPFFPLPNQLLKKRSPAIQMTRLIASHLHFQKPNEGRFLHYVCAQGGFMPVFVCFHYCIFPLGTWGNR